MIAPWLVRACALGAAMGMFSAAAFAVTTTLAPAKDNTLFLSDTGSLSAGAGTDLFIGSTSGGSVRRTVLAFDLTSIPSNAVVSSATLTLFVNKSVAGSNETVDVHRLTASWGEGTSINSNGNPGSATTNDATWLYRFYNSSSWTNAGGDFSSTVSATQSIGNFGAFSWSGAGLVSDVQAWLSSPSSNFGWILVGDETDPTSVRKISSRENATVSQRPSLSITYSVAVPEPGFAGVLMLPAVAVRRRGRR
jgi:hypothetical protein